MEIQNDASAAVETAAPETASVEVSTSSEAGTGSVRDSIDRAFAAVDGGDAAPVAKPAEQVSTGDRARGPDGKFVAADGQPVADPAKPVEAKAPTPLDEAPSRFSPDAKAIWKDVPDAVRGEVRRAISELESGINGYREKMDPIKPFFEMAARGGTDLQTALTKYTNIETLLRQNPVAGLQEVCNNMGFSLHELAASIMGQQPDAQASQQEATIRELRQQITRLEHGFQNVSGSIEQQQMAQLHNEIAAFAQGKPRFEELRPTIGKLLESGMAQDLEGAYDMAERLNPSATPQAQPIAQQVAPTPATPPAVSTAARQPDPAVQTRKGSLSVTGAPSSGSNPANRKPSSSPRESVDRAFASLGLA